MKLVEVNNKEKLNDFVLSQKYSQFLQSWQWGEFQERMGNKVFRLGIEDDNRLVAAATLIKNRLLLGKSYFYCPRGPIVISKIKDQKAKTIEFLFAEIKKIARKENAIFLRFEPGSQIASRKLQIIKSIDIQPSKTLVLDLSGSEEEILNRMHQKTRYNIRLSEKKEVRVRPGQENDFEIFWRLMEDTRKRDRFRLHAKEYYKKMIATDNIELLVARYENKIIAGIIIACFGDSGVYIHGASSNEYRNAMAPYSLQWEAIKLAKAKNCLYYDLNGADEKK